MTLVEHDSSLEDVTEAVTASSDIVLAILGHLTPQELLLVRGVNHQFKELADVLQQPKFQERWGIASMVRQPRHPLHYAAVRQEHFAMCHWLNQRETLAGIALAHGTSIPELRRFNNLMSDHTASREALFIPTTNPAAAVGKHAAFVYDAHSKRRFVVLLEEGEELPAGLRKHAAQAHERSDAAVNRLAGMLERSLGITCEEARYYISQAQGDVRAAIEACSQDARWARVMRRAHSQGQGSTVQARLLAQRL